MLTDLHEEVLLKIFEIIQSSNEKLCWGLTGSTSFAIQGLNVEPHDIDIQTDKSSAYILGNLLKKYEIQQVAFCGNDKIKSHFGKFVIDGMEVEIMGDIQKKTNNQWEAVIPIQSLLDYACWNGLQIPVIKLTHEVDAYKKLGRIEKVKLIEDFLKQQTNNLNVSCSYC